MIEDVNFSQSMSHCRTEFHIRCIAGMKIYVNITFHPRQNCRLQYKEY